MNKASRWLKRGAIALFAIVLVPLLAELAIQLIGDPRKQAMVAEAKQLPAYWELARDGVLVGDDRALRFRLKPGFDVTVDGIEYRVNELGLRGGPLALAKQDGARRVLIVGDSYAFGLGVHEEEALARQLELQLGANGVKDVEVVNFGVPAYQTEQERVLLERLGFTLSPDLVVLLYYPNDNVEAALTLAPALGATYIDELPLPYSWKAFLSRSYLYSLAAKLDAHRRDERGEFESRGTHNWPITVERLRRVAATCRDHHVAFLFAPLPELSSHQQLNDDASAVALEHARALDLARAEGWPVVDLRAGLRQHARAVEKLFLSVTPLDNHLNPEGYRAVASTIAPEAGKLLLAAK